jgi:hypothetical protein
MGVAGAIQLCQALPSVFVCGRVSGGYGRTELATVLEFVVATYGTEQLPRFVAALGEHSRLETLIPAVFELSSEEFERDWRAFLAALYQLE